jgi:hypothetical protein
MRRTLEFLKWKSSLWAVKSPKSNQSLSSPLHEGLSAYAFRQADVFMSLHNHFLSLWRGFKELNKSPDDPTPVPIQIEEEMQGVEGGDVVLSKWSLI